MTKGDHPNNIAVLYKTLIMGWRTKMGQDQSKLARKLRNGR
jgi:hypothetical protein